MKKPSVRLIVLGCPKNRADAESVAGYLAQAGFSVTENDVPADCAVLLTCAFVRDAEDEAMEHVVALMDRKRAGEFRAVVLTGCMPQRHKDEDARSALPDVDAWVGASDYPKIASIVEKALGGKNYHHVSNRAGYLPGGEKRIRLGHEPYAYVKVSEGCRNRCAYCAIPAIRGDFRSRPMARIVDEAASLVEGGGVKEIVLVGQDTALYGADIYNKRMLATLLNKVARRIPKTWVRVMYSHPAHIADDALDAIADNDNVCPYLDIPIQHAATSVLKRMGRPGSREKLAALFAKIREKIPGVTLRTTVMVGFPGETEREFRELIAFMNEVRFERLGAFPYSREEGTPAYSLPRQVGERVKHRRLDEVMRLQQEIAWDMHQDLVGLEFDVIVDGPAPDREGWSYARSMRHAPEVDAGIYIERPNLAVGMKTRVKIIDALAYDLEGEIVV